MFDSPLGYHFAISISSGSDSNGVPFLWAIPLD